MRDNRNSLGPTQWRGVNFVARVRAQKQPWGDWGCCRNVLGPAPDLPPRWRVRATVCGCMCMCMTMSDCVWQCAARAAVCETG